MKQMKTMQEMGFRHFNEDKIDLKCISICLYQLIGEKT